MQLGAGMGVVLLSHPTVVLVAALWGALGGCGVAQEAGSPHSSGSAEGAHRGCGYISLLPGIVSCPPVTPLCPLPTRPSCIYPHPLDVQI